LDPIEQIVSTKPSVQLDNSNPDAFVSQFIFSDWQMASQRRLFCLPNSI